MNLQDIRKQQRNHSEQKDTLHKYKTYLHRVQEKGTTIFLSLRGYGFKILLFVVMQRVTWVCQRQLSYLSKFFHRQT